MSPSSASLTLCAAEALEVVKQRGSHAPSRTASGNTEWGRGWATKKLRFEQKAVAKDATGLVVDDGGWLGIRKDSHKENGAWLTIAGAD